MDIRVARDVGPLSSLCKKGRNCLFVINGRRWAWVLHLLEGGVEVDGFTLKRENSQVLDGVVIEVSNESTSSAGFLIGTRRLDVVKLAWFGTPQTVSNAVDGTLTAARTGFVSGVTLGNEDRIILHVGVIMISDAGDWNALEAFVRNLIDQSGRELERGISLELCHDLIIGSLENDVTGRVIRRELDSRESLIEGEVEPFEVSRSVDLICLILEEFGVGDGRFHNTRHFFRQKLVLEMTRIERVLGQQSSPNSVSTSRSCGGSFPEENVSFREGFPGAQAAQWSDVSGDSDIHPEPGLALRRPQIAPSHFRGIFRV